LQPPPGFDPVAGSDVYIAMEPLGPSGSGGSVVAP
jgi:hypothetical protein